MTSGLPNKPFHLTPGVAPSVARFAAGERQHHPDLLRSRASVYDGVG